MLVFSGINVPAIYPHGQTMQYLEKLKYGQKGFSKTRQRLAVKVLIWKIFIPIFNVILSSVYRDCNAIQCASFTLFMYVVL